MGRGSESSLLWGISALRGDPSYGAHEAAVQLAAFQLAAAQEAAAQLAAFQEADDQLAWFQDAFAQLAAFQEAFAHEAWFQEAWFHEAWFQEAFAVTAFAQLAESKATPPVPSAPTYWFRPRFGLGGFVASKAAFAFSSPTPRDMLAAAVGRAVSISAPLTLSGVQFGFLARISAAAPETIGAENDVPDIHM